MRPLSEIGQVVYGAGVSSFIMTIDGLSREPHPRTLAEPHLINGGRGVTRIRHGRRAGADFVVRTNYPKAKTLFKIVRVVIFTTEKAEKPVVSDGERRQKLVIKVVEVGVLDGASHSNVDGTVYPVGCRTVHRHGHRRMGLDSQAIRSTN